MERKVPPKSLQNGEKSFICGMWSVGCDTIILESREEKLVYFGRLDVIERKVFDGLSEGTDFYYV
jgi:hypothetical protein